MELRTPADFQARVRRQVREDTMDAAYQIISEHGWPALRMTTVAAAVGVSRPTLYKEFGSKHDLGTALLVREAERFTEGVAECLSRHDDVPSAIEAMIRFVLTRAEGNPLLIAILSGPAQDCDSLLPILTTRAEPLFAPAVRALVQHIFDRHPGPHDDITPTVDALARLLISHLLSPGGDRDTTISQLTRLTCLGLSFTPPDPAAPPTV